MTQDLLERSSILASLQNGEFLSCSLRPQDFSLSWSCDLPLSELMARLLALLPGHRDSPTSVESAAGHARYASLGAVRESSVPTQSCLSMEIDCVGLTLVWEQWSSVTGPYRTASRVPHGRFGLLSDVFDCSLYADLVRATGTPEVAAGSDESRHLIDLVGQKREPCDLRTLWARRGEVPTPLS